MIKIDEGNKAGGATADKDEEFFDLFFILVFPELEGVT